MDIIARTTTAEIAPGLPVRGDMPLPPMAHGEGFVGRTFRDGGMTVYQLAAAADMLRAWDSQLPAAGNVKAMDISKIRVDGGRRPSGGLPADFDAYDGAFDRFSRYASLVENRDRTQAWILGRRGEMRILDIMFAVLRGGWSPDSLDETLGVRHGRVKSVVLAELTVYASLAFCKQTAHFSP